MAPRITQFSIRHYKSIADAAVTLEPFTVLVGPNGSGKSNFIDALAFVQESLSQSVELAFKNRGGIKEVRRRSAGHPTHIALRVRIDFGQGRLADYGFEIAARPTERFRIARERCIVRGFFEADREFEIRNGEFTKGKQIPGIRPKLTPDRLALFVASATEEFRPVYDFLSTMRFYSIVPGRIRELQEPDPGDYLLGDGSNSAAVLKRMEETANGPDSYERLCRLLAKVAEGVEKVEYEDVGRQKETIVFRQKVGLQDPWEFSALNMSDGTLRTLGILLALYQPGEHSVVAIEEPEATIHPAAAEVIMQALLDAARDRQVLVTTHSPDLLDYKELTDDQIRAVTMENNGTHIRPLSRSSRETIRDGLYTPGELLRDDELAPEEPQEGSPTAQQDFWVQISGEQSDGT